jgi:hypothetical protein
MVFLLPETLYPRRRMLEGEKGRGVVGEEKMNMEGREEGLPRRTKGLGWANVKPLEGIKHPRVWDTLVRFGKTWRLTSIVAAIMSYCFGWYLFILSVVTLIPIAYGELYPEPHTQG